MIIKTSELIGDDLDYAVHLATDPKGYGIQHWSTDWEFGGPLIEKYEVGFYQIPYALNEGRIPDSSILAFVGRAEDAFCAQDGQIGETRLIAAMRAIVAHKLGDAIRL